MKKSVSLLIRLTLTVALLAYLIIRSDAGQMLDVLSSVRIGFLAVVFSLIFLDALVRSISWGTLLKTREIHLTVPQTLYVYLTGGFFGTFLPSSLGTDVARMVMLTKNRSTQPRDSALSVLVMNLVNLLALCLVALFSALILATFQADQLFVSMVVLFCLAYMIAFPFLVRGKVPFEEQLLRIPKLDKLVNKSQEYADALRAYMTDRKTFGIVLLASFASQVLSYLVAFTLSRALILDIPFFYFVLVMPVLTISRVIPLSIAGFGVEQGVFVYLFHQLGVPPAEALPISLSLSVANICFTLSGGLLYLVNNFESLIREIRTPKVNHHIRD